MERRKILIVTKTYPEISKTYSETVCTAGILLNEDETPEHWVRIYPIRFRELDYDKRYAKWTVISALIERNSKDYRWESYRIDDQSIEIIRKIGTENSWEERRLFFETPSLMYSSIEEIKERNNSLGVIRPQIVKYFYESCERKWPESKQLVLDQGDLFRLGNNFSDLEKIPYKFFYKFPDDTGKHNCSIIDWEICQLYRSMKNSSRMETETRKEADALEKVRIKLADQLTQKDIHFLMGNLKSHKNSFVIIGLIYPPKIEEKQLSLF